MIAERTNLQIPTFNYLDQTSTPQQSKNSLKPQPSDMIKSYKQIHPNKHLQHKIHRKKSKQHMSHSKSNKKSVLCSKQRVVVELVQKVISGMNSQLQSQLKKDGLAPQIMLNNLQIHRIKEIKNLLQNMSQFDGNVKQKAQKNVSKIEPIKATILQQYIERQQYLKAELRKLLETMLNRPCRKRSLVDLCDQVSSLLLQLKKKAENNSRLQSDSKKMRKHYLGELQNYKEQIQFVTELLHMKEIEIVNLSSKISVLEKDRSTYVPTKTVDDVKPAQMGLPHFRQPSHKDIELLIDIPCTTSEYQSRYNPSSPSSINVNPQSNHKSKSLLLHYPSRQSDLNAKMEEEMAIYCELGEVNSRMKELSSLLNEQLQKSQCQISYQIEKLEVLNSESALLQQNLQSLNLIIQQRQQEIATKQEMFFQASQKVIFKQEELSSLQEQVSVLTNQRLMEQYNIERVQEQLDFLKNQCGLVRRELEQVVPQ